MKNLSLGWFVACLFYTVSNVQAEQSINYTPEARLKYAEKNRANHISIIALRFSELCPTKVPYPNLRLVAKKFENGSVVVNPKGEDLGWSLNNLDLSKLHIDTAKKILCAKDNGDGSFTCELVADRPDLIKENYEIDLKFSNEFLCSYRLRGLGIIAPAWVENSER